MIRAVLDANVLVSGFPAEAGVPARLVELWARGRYELVVSEPLLAEASRAWGRPYYAARYAAADAEETLARLRQEAILTPITVRVAGVATHPEDDLVLAAAVSARSDYLVTGDRQLQKLGAYQGVAILSPRAFLDLLAAQEAPRP